MKRKMRMFVALSCIAALLVTGPGLSVSASEPQDAEIAAEAIGEEVVGSVSDVIQEQTIEETETSDAEQEDTSVDEQYSSQDTSTVTEADIQEKTDDVAETPAQEIGLEIFEEEAAVESQVGQSDEANQDDDLSDLTDDVENAEENVGLSYYPLENFPVGDNVTATLYWSAYTGWPVTYSVTLDVYDGTISSSWKEMIGEEIANSEWTKEITHLDINVKSGKLHLPSSANSLFAGFSKIETIEFGSGIDTSNVATMDMMFANCEKLKTLDLSGFNVSHCFSMMGMFYNCKTIKKLNLSNFKTDSLWWIAGMFSDCTSLQELDISSMSLLGIFTSTPAEIDTFLENCNSLKILKTPTDTPSGIPLPKTMYDDSGKAYTQIPNVSKSITLRYPARLNIKNATLYGITRSYGYTGSPHTPNFYVGMNGKTLVANTDYTYKFTNNVKPGIGKLTVTGKGDYTGTLTYNFTIVDCVDVPQDGCTYRLVPKNNPEAVLCAAGGNMVNNTKVTITSPNTSEAQKFVVKKNSDGTFKIYNAKSMMAVAVQQNSTVEGKGVVIYQNTTREAQKWKFERKADNSYAIVNAVTGFSISSPNTDATIGSQLIMKKTAASSLQRFYFVSADPVPDDFGGKYVISCAKNSNYVIDIAAGSTAAGANAQLYKSNGTDAQKYELVYSGSGYYRLVNKKSGLVLTVKNNSATSGANVEQQAWQALSGQKWWVKYNEEDDTVTMRNGLGTYLHLTSNKVQNGTNICAKTQAATTAQRWNLKPY